MIEDKRYYQKITGHVRAATLTGKFFSSCLAQILAISFGTPPFNALVYMSIFGIHLSFNNYSLGYKRARKLRNLPSTHWRFTWISVGNYIEEFERFILRWNYLEI